MSNSKGFRAWSVGGSGTGSGGGPGRNSEPRRGLFLYVVCHQPFRGRQVLFGGASQALAECLRCWAVVGVRCTYSDALPPWSVGPQSTLPRIQPRLRPGDPVSLQASDGHSGDDSRSVWMVDTRLAPRRNGPPQRRKDDGHGCGSTGCRSMSRTSAGDSVVRQ